MNIFEAREAEGKRVKYDPGHGPVEYGTVTGFSDPVYVFVRYDGERSAKATNPGDLELAE